jgi:hypothetical protein
MKLLTSLPSTSIVLIVSVLLTALACGVEDKLLRQDYVHRSTRYVQPFPDGDVDNNESRFLKSTLMTFAGQDSSSAEYIEEEAILDHKENKYKAC